MAEDCEYPPCSKPGRPRRAANIYESGGRYILSLCDEHYEKMLRYDPDLVEWLITLIWPAKL